MKMMVMIVMIMRLTLFFHCESILSYFTPYVLFFSGLVIE